MPTAGFGAFAGRAFKKDELVHISSKTLFLPEYFPESQVLGNYVFGYNKTHMGLILDYGSLFNHHESANVEAGGEVAGSSNVEFMVRLGFQAFNVLITMF